MISGIADKMNSPLGFVRSNIGTMLRYSDTLMELCERITELKARKTWTEEDLRQALNDEVKWMGQSRIENIGQSFSPLAKETVQGIDRIAAIVRKLMQIELAGRHSEKSSTNMRHLIDIIVERIRERTPGITISIESDMKPFLYECDKVRISAALENIIENAIESINGEGWILIKLCNDKDSIKIEISDTGVGIPQNSLDSVFDPFFSAHSRTGKIGLGLTVAKYLINAHEGSIDINSCEGQGTRVSVELPLVKTEATLHKGTFISS
jgi:two-component system, NtrC family, sensor kinase